MGKFSTFLVLILSCGSLNFKKGSFLGASEKPCYSFEKHGVINLLFLFCSYVNANGNLIKYQEKCWLSKDFGNCCSSTANISKRVA